MKTSTLNKQINIIYKFKEYSKETKVEKLTSLKELKEKIESEIKFTLAKMKLVYNKSNILLNNENYKIYDFFGDVKSIILIIEPQEFTEENYIEKFEKAFLGKFDGEELLTDENILNNINKNKNNNSDKKYLKNIVIDKVYQPKIKERPICNYDKQNKATYICIKCRLLWCKHCIKYEVHKSDLVELDFLHTYLNMKRSNYSKEVEEHIINDTHYNNLEKIDFILNEKISVIEKQFEEMTQLLLKIKESQMKTLIDLFYQQVDNKQFKSILTDIQYFKNKVMEINSQYNKENLEENLNNNDIIEKFKELIKQNFNDFKFKYDNYFNIFTQFENFNTTFQSQIEAKFKQSNSIRINLNNPEELNKIVNEDKNNNLNKLKTPQILKMKYYNTILQWDYIKQKVNRIQNFVDKFEFKLNYQVYSGNIFLNYMNRLFILTGTNFNMFYYFDFEKNEMIRLNDLVENHCRGSLIYVESLNCFVCVSGKFGNKCERFDLTNFKFENEENEKNNNKNKSLNNSINNSQSIWTDFPNLNYQRHSASLFIHNNKSLYCFFGYYSNRGSFDIIEKINLETLTNWEIINFSNTRFLDMKLSSHACVYANIDEVYILGGSINDKYSDKIFKYNFIQNAIYLTDFIIPGLKENEYFRFWEESRFQSLSSYGHVFNSDDDYTFGMFDAREKLHLFNVRNFKYTII